MLSSRTSTDAHNLVELFERIHLHLDDHRSAGIAEPVGQELPGVDDRLGGRVPGRSAVAEFRPQGQVVVLDQHGLEQAGPMICPPPERTADSSMPASRASSCGYRRFWQGSRPPDRHLPGERGNPGKPAQEVQERPLGGQQGPSRTRDVPNGLAGQQALAIGGGRLPLEPGVEGVQRVGHSGLAGEDAPPPGDHGGPADGLFRHQGRGGPIGRLAQVFVDG